MSAYGFVYVLGNAAMPGIYKIGMTERAPLQRAEELSGATAAPMPFSVLCYGEVVDPQMMERKAHSWFEEFRVSENREFFQCRYTEIHEYIQRTALNFVATDRGSMEYERASHEKDREWRNAAIWHYLSQSADPIFWGDE